MSCSVGLVVAAVVAAAAASLLPAVVVAISTVPLLVSAPHPRAPCAISLDVAAKFLS